MAFGGELAKVREQTNKQIAPAIAVTPKPRSSSGGGRHQQQQDQKQETAATAVDKANAEISGVKDTPSKVTTAAKSEKLYSSYEEMTSPKRYSIFNPAETFVESSYEKSKDLGQYGILGSTAMLGSQAALGFGNFFLQTGKSILYPAETIKNVGYAVTHPLQAGAAIGEHIADKPVFSMGEVAGSRVLAKGINAITKPRISYEIGDMSVKEVGLKNIPVSVSKNMIISKEGLGYEVVGDATIKYSRFLRKPIYQQVSFDTQYGVLPTDLKGAIVRDISKGLSMSKTGDLSLAIGRGTSDTWIKGKQMTTPFITKQYSIEFPNEAVSIGQSMSKTGKTLGFGAAKPISDSEFAYLGTTSAGKEAFPTAFRIKMVSPAAESSNILGTGARGLIQTGKTSSIVPAISAGQIAKQVVTSAPKMEFSSSGLGFIAATPILTQQKSQIQPAFQKLDTRQLQKSMQIVSPQQMTKQFQVTPISFKTPSAHAFRQTPAQIQPVMSGQMTGQESTQEFQMPQQMRFPSPIKPISPLVPTPTSYIPPVMPFNWKLDFGKTKGLSFSGLQKTKYTPSLKAITFNIKASTMPKFAFTGLGTRPIISSKRRKRRLK